MVIILVIEKAYAKVNLFLNVVGKRTDGYHELEMLMASIDLCDLVSFEPIVENQIKVTSNVTITNNPNDNIVYQITSYIKEKYQINTGLHIHINKVIPIAAGLAGGSADAAATLRGLNRLWNLGLSLEELANIGLQFGSDIPFCIYNKLAIARGRGELLTFIDVKLNIPILLVNPNIQIPTKEIFQALRTNHFTTHSIQNIVDAVSNRDFHMMEKTLYNSLEQITFAMEPSIQNIKQQMIQLGLNGALMSGSGATVFAISDNQTALEKAAKSLNSGNFIHISKVR